MSKKLIDELLDTADAVKTVKNSVRGLLDEVRRDTSGSKKSKRSDYDDDDNIIDEPTFVDHGNVVTESTTMHYTSSGDYKNQKFMAPQLYKNPESERKSAVAQQIVGYSLCATNAIFSIGNVLKMFSETFTISNFAWASFLAIATAIFFCMGIKGTARAIFTGRFKEYLKAFGEKTILSFKDLAYAVGKSERFVREDVRKMIDKKMFKQGHFDSDEQVLITADATYKDYLKYEKRMKEIEAHEQDYDSMLADQGLTPEGIRIVKLCEEQIAKIHEINEILPEEEISQKLDTLENTVKDLVIEVKKQPSKAGELRKTTNYYLPTIIRLFESYIEIEEQDEKTDKLNETQIEIETMLDTLNSSFQVLLERLQMNREWDVSADISVMKTMLNMEGLSGEQQIKK